MNKFTNQYQTQNYFKIRLENIVHEKKIAGKKAKILALHAKNITIMNAINYFIILNANVFNYLIKIAKNSVKY